MKKKAIVITIVALIIIISAAIFLKLNKKETISTSVTPSDEKIELYGQYIWESERIPNSWISFRKTFEIKNEKDIKDVEAQIIADTKYWLYINGTLVQREGGLKNGETPSTVYCDTIDITDYLHKGENTVAILTWFFGAQCFSYNPIAQLGMLFQTTIGDMQVATDSSWKMWKNEAFIYDEIQPNNRIAEFNVYYDARKEEADWYKEDFDDSNWENAVVQEVNNSIPIRRPIPQFKDYGLKDYENSEEYKGYTTKKDEVLELKLPYNAQILPYLKVEAPEAKGISMFTDTYNNDGALGVRSSYLTKDGVQEYEAYGWINGEKVYYQIPEGVKILELKYRETGYDTEFVGSFTSDDEFLNKLWNQAQRTLYVNMRDSYMDCPNRERTQWSLDMNIEMLESFYAFDTKTYPLYTKGIYTISGWNVDGTLLAIAPNLLDDKHLPVQSLLTIAGAYDYYLYSGDTELISRFYPYARNYLNFWSDNIYGSLQCNSTYQLWEWGDSGNVADYKQIENFAYYYAEHNLCEIAKVLNFEQDVAEYEKELAKLKERFNKTWTDETGYKSPIAGFVDDRVHAFAVLSGVADEDKYPIIKNLLVKNQNSSSCMEYYVLEALSKMGYVEEAQNRIKDRYKEMVEGKNACSTLWEFWSYEAGSPNHAWSGGPLVTMSKYMAGISPKEVGYETVSIKPNLGNLKTVKASCNTIKGDISVEAKVTDDGYILEYESPANTVVGIPKKYSNYKITINGKEEKSSSSDENYIYFETKDGKYAIICKNN